MPNMSHTSRSSQFAPSHNPTTEGTVGSGSLTKHRTVIRSLVSVLANKIDQAEAVFGVRVMQIIDARHVHQKIETVFLLERFEDLVQRFDRRNDPRLAAKLARGQTGKAAPEVFERLLAHGENVTISRLSFREH